MPRLVRQRRRQQRLPKGQQQRSFRQNRGQQTLLGSSSRKQRKAAEGARLQLTRQCMAAGPAAGGPRPAALLQMARRTALEGPARRRMQRGKRRRWRRGMRPLAAAL